MVANECIIIICYRIAVNGARQTDGCYGIRYRMQYRNSYHNRVWGMEGGNDKLARSTSHTIDNNYNIIRTYIRRSLSFNPDAFTDDLLAELILKTIYTVYYIYKMMADKNETKRSVPYDAMLVRLVRYRPQFGSTQNMFTQRSRFIPNPTGVGWFGRVQTVVSTRRRSSPPPPSSPSTSTLPSPSFRQHMLSCLHSRYRSSEDDGYRLPSELPTTPPPPFCSRNRLS